MAAVDTRSGYTEAMLGDDQILTLIRERVDHPATLRELLQLLRIPKEERAAFRRRLKHLVATGALIETRGRHYGLPDRMDLVVGRLDMNPQGYGFVVPERRSTDVNGDIYIAGSQSARTRCTATASSSASSASATTAAPRAGSSASSSARHDRSSAASSSTPAASGFVVPFDRRMITDVQVAGRRDARRRAGRDGDGRDHALADRRRAPRSAGSSRCSATSTRPASTLQIIIRKYGIPDAHCDDGRRRSAPPRRRRCASGTSSGRTDFRADADRDHRRRARARFRRRDHDREAAERQLLARRAHRRRLALRRRAARSTTRPTSAARRSTSPSAPCTCSRPSWRPACAA